MNDYGKNKISRRPDHIFNQICRFWHNETCQKKKKNMIFKISFSYVYLAVERARMIARQADIIAAMSLEVLKGTTRGFDVCKYNNTSNQGQIEWNDLSCQYYKHVVSLDITVSGQCHYLSNYAPAPPLV